MITKISLKFSAFTQIVLTPYELGIALGEFEWDSNIYFDKELTENKLRTESEQQKELEEARNYQLTNM